MDNFPRNPPSRWLDLETLPAWHVPKRNLTVATDGPDRGRACGYLAPKAGSVPIMGDPGGRMNPPFGPLGARLFHAGNWNLTADDGEGLVARQIGSICLQGGHSDRAPGGPATSAEDARDWLARLGSHSDRTDDLTLYGRCYETRDGILFLGAAYPWATDLDIDVINATTVSAEFMPSPQNPRMLEFVGAARVLRTAIAAEDLDVMPVAATLENGAVTVTVGAPEAGLIPDGTPVDDRGGALAGYEVTDEPTVANPKGGPPAGQAEPVMAEVSDADLAALTSRLDDLTSEVAALAEELFNLAAKLITGDELTLSAQLDGITTRLAELEMNSRDRSTAPTPPSTEAGPETAAPAAVAR